MKLLYYLINLGIQDKDSRFQRRLKKAVNVLTLNAIVCILIASILSQFQRENAGFDVLYGLPFYFFVLYLNIKGKSYTAITFLFSVSALMLGFFSLKTGPEAFTHSLYILNIIGVSLIYRKEAPKFYFYFNLGFTLLCFTFILVSFQYHFMDFLLEKNQDTIGMRQTNLSFLIICSIVFSIVVIVTNNRQHSEMEAALTEQKVLLAELHHRVKNNLSVIVGLINLKKSVSNNSASISALTEIRDRVMSMALVHQMMYQNGTQSSIDFGEYCKQLILEIKKSMQPVKETEIKSLIPSLEIDVSSAIPLGLIVNELFTNSFKHAFSTTDNPRITMELEQDLKNIILKYKDNGSGLTSDYADKGSLGLNLIQGLTEQLEGNSIFANKDGFAFEMKFPRKALKK